MSTKGKYKSTVKQGKDSTAVSIGNYDRDTGILYQQNTKYLNGEHTFYNNATGVQGWHGAHYDKESVKK